MRSCSAPEYAPIPETRLLRSLRCLAAFTTFAAFAPFAAFTSFTAFARERYSLHDRSPLRICLLRIGRLVTCDTFI
jgi:hypothetical protein